MNSNFVDKRNIRIAISSYCNFDCSYCGGHKGYTKDKKGSMEDYRHDTIDGYFLKTDEIKSLLKYFYEAGFRGVTLTGGEPLVNKDWYRIIQYAKQIGYERREITTNAALLKKYLQNNGFPNDLTLVKVSFDTIDRNAFNFITKSNSFDSVVESIKMISGKIKTRANRVVLRSQLQDLNEYIDFCKNIGFKSINLLDLVYYPNRRNSEEKKYFEKEFVSATEIKDFLELNFNYKFKRGKYGYSSLNSNEIEIIIKESRFTLRDEQCFDCPIYCQEGKFTVRIATDGNITMCPDCYCELTSLSGQEILSGVRGVEEIRKLFNSLIEAEEFDTFDTFILKHSVNLER